MGAVSKSFHHGLNYPQRPRGPAVYVAFRHARPRPRPCRISATTQRRKLPCRSNVKQAGDAKIFRFNSSPARHMAASCQFATQSTAQGRGASPLNMVFPRFHKRVQRARLGRPKLLCPLSFSPYPTFCAIRCPNTNAPDKRYATGTTDMSPVAFRFRIQAIPYWPIFKSDYIADCITCYATAGTLLLDTSVYVLTCILSRINPSIQSLGFSDQSLSSLLLALYFLKAPSNLFRHPHVHA